MTLSFDERAEYFDEQRRMPERAFRALSELIESLTSHRPVRIFEPGIGTGRVAIPLAQAGHVVSGIDISAKMLAKCEAKIQEFDLHERVTIAVGDATAVPFDTNEFDVGIVASLLYLVPEWTKVIDELQRVLTSEGAIVFLREDFEAPSVWGEWDKTWRLLAGEYGIRHEAMHPDDHEVEAEFVRRGMPLVTHELQSQLIRQTVEMRKNNLRQSKKLYPDMPDEVWDELVQRYLAVMTRKFPNEKLWMGAFLKINAVVARQP